MRYTYIQRKGHEPFITIGEYIQAMVPEVFKKLRAFITKEQDVTEFIIAAADVQSVDRYYQRIMQERPKPGRGGLLPGEGDEVLYG